MWKEGSRWFWLQNDDLSIANKHIGFQPENLGGVSRGRLVLEGSGLRMVVQ